MKKIAESISTWVHVYTQVGAYERQAGRRRGYYSDSSFADRLGTNRQRTQRRRHPQTRCLTTGIAYSNTRQVTLGKVKLR